MSDSPVPSLNLPDKAALIDKKQSFGKKLQQSFKKIVTPRTGSTGSLDTLSKQTTDTVDSVVDSITQSIPETPSEVDVPADVKDAVTGAPATIKEALSGTEDVAKTQLSRLGKEADSLKTEATDAIKAAGKNEDVKKIVGVVVAVVAIIAGVVAASTSKKSTAAPAPAAAPAKKGRW